MFLCFTAMVGCTPSADQSNEIDTDSVDIPFSADGKTKSKLAQISFDKTEVDAGKLLQGDVRHFSFEFTNTGKAPLVISDISASCGCTVPRSYPRGKIMPGEGGTIEVDYNSDNKWGDQVSVVAVVTNTPNPRNELIIRAHVVAPNMPK